MTRSEQDSPTNAAIQTPHVCLPSVGSCVRSVSTTLLPRAATASTVKNNDPQSATQRGQEQPIQQQTVPTGFIWNSDRYKGFRSPAFQVVSMSNITLMDGSESNTCSNWGRSHTSGYSPNYMWLKTKTETWCICFYGFKINRWDFITIDSLITANKLPNYPSDKKQHNVEH